MDYRQVIREQIEHLQAMQKRMAGSAAFDSDAACKIAETILHLCQQITSLPIKEYLSQALKCAFYFAIEKR